MVTSYWLGAGRATSFIIDPDGEIVWWYQTDLDGICRARMSEDGKNMWMVVSDTGGGYLGRVTMDTLDYESYRVGASHDLTPVSGSTMAYIDFSEGDCNSIYEIEPDGTTHEVWESADIISGACHGNALRYSAAEDVFTFSNLQSDVLMVSRAGEYLWSLSDIVGPNTVWGSRQHGHHLLDDSIVIFANEAGNNAAAVIEYDLNGNQIMFYDGGLYNRNLGDVQRLPDGNTLVTYSNAASFIREIDPEGNVVLEIDARDVSDPTAAALGYTVWRKSLYGPPDDFFL
jgi:hypothetical protein